MLKAVEKKKTDSIDPERIAETVKACLNNSSPVETGWPTGDKRVFTWNNQDYTWMSAETFRFDQWTWALQSD